MAGGVPGVLQVGAVLALPASVHRRLCGGEGVSVGRTGLGVMSRRRFPSRRVSWRVSGRCLRTYGWS